MSYFREILNFTQFLLKKTYSQGKTLKHHKELVLEAFELTVKDVNYHYPTTTSKEVYDRITSNQNELGVFLYRLGNQIYKMQGCKILMQEIHWLLKEVCSCEIYFSTHIGEGFYLFHGEGLVIGSRNIIGKGLRIYQNVTIGQKYKDSEGVCIGDNVKIYVGAKVLGNITIGSNVIIGSNTIITKNIPNNALVHSNPNKIRYPELNLRTKLI